MVGGPLSVERGGRRCWGLVCGCWEFCEGCGGVFGLSLCPHTELSNACGAGPFPIFVVPHAVAAEGNGRR